MIFVTVFIGLLRICQEKYQSNFFCVYSNVFWKALISQWKSIWALHGDNENTLGETHSTSSRRKMRIFLLQSKNWSVLDQYFAATEKVVFICLRLEIYPRQINIYLGSGLTLKLQFIFNTLLENLKFIIHINGQWASFSRSPSYHFCLRYLCIRR